MPVEGDDVVVGQFLLARAGRPAVGEVDLVLRGARPERLFRRPVGAHAGGRRLGHALDFVGRFGRPRVIQGAGDGRRVMVAEAFGRRRRLPQDGPAALAGFALEFGRRADHREVEMRRPVGFGRRRRQEPVVVRLVEDELRAVPGPVDHETVRGVVGQPGPVTGVRPERVGAVVEVVIDLTSRPDDESVVTARRQSAVGPRRGRLAGVRRRARRVFFSPLPIPGKVRGKRNRRRDCRKMATFAYPCNTGKIRRRDVSAKLKIELFTPRKCT